MSLSLFLLFYLFDFYSTVDLINPSIFFKINVFFYLLNKKKEYVSSTQNIRKKENTFICDITIINFVYTKKKEKPTSIVCHCYRNGRIIQK